MNRRTGQRDGKPPDPDSVHAAQDFKFGSGPSMLTFGHNGSYGTVMWADPTTGVSFVFFTAEPSFTETDELRHATRLAVAAVRFSAQPRGQL